MDELIHEDLATLSNVTGFLKQCVGKGKEIPPGNILQVQQVTNLSFPTYDKPNYDADKHTLKLSITDGQSQGYALVPDSCPGISLNTAPGTKIRTTQPIPVHGSFLILSRNNCEVLGGRVAKLYEKWEIQKTMAIKHDWGYSGTVIDGEGPPPWKPFGYKPAIDVAALRKMKTVDVVNDKRDKQAGVAKSQFDMQRDEAISELQATASKQKFQKPNKHLIDKEITDIMDEGFSQSEAEYAMKRFKNPQKALKFLKESKQRQDGIPEPPKPIVERKDRRKKGKGIDDDEEQEVPAEYQRPTRNISLFGFIEGQIKSDSDKPPQSNGPAQRSHQGGRGRDFEDGMGRLNIRESHSESYSSRNERGRGRGGYRGGRGDGGGNRGTGGGGRGDNNRDSYHSQRYDNKLGPTPSDSVQKPPRFQQRGGGSDNSRSSDYYRGPPRGHSGGGGGYDNNYKGQSRESYNSHESKEPSRSYNENSGNRQQDYSGNYHQQQYHQQRLPSDKDRSHPSSEYRQQQYSHSNEYPPVPSQNYQQQQHSYPQQQQQHHQPPRQYMNSSSQNYDSGGGSSYGSGSYQQRGQSHYSNNSRGGGMHSNQQQHNSEFSQYQYGYEGWNPAQSLVFTRSKGDTRGRGGGSRGGGGGAPPNHSAGRSYQSNRY